MKAVREVGLRRVVRYVWTSFLLGLLRLAVLPPTRRLFLKLCGAKIGRDTVVHRLTLINVDRGGFGNLRVGDSCFIGEEVLLDLAAPVVLEDHVSLATRTVILTHLNVGWADHPMQGRYPAMTGGVTVRRGSFIGAQATVLAGTTIGPESFVAAASLVNRDVVPGELVGGVPIRSLRAPDVEAP